MSSSDILQDYNSDTSWALIPSDPAIFNDMIGQYGVKNTKVEEVFSLDFEDLTKNGSVHGLMFVSKYVEEELPATIEDYDPDAENVVFTAQVVTNVCGTLALLAILLNANIERGEILDNFLDFTDGFSAVDRGLCLGNSIDIRKIHDAYATNANHTAEAAMTEAAEAGGDNGEFVDADTFHYVSYIHKNGFLWELDGLKGKPVKLAKCSEETWLEVVKPILEKRMNSTLDNELTFNLMAVTHDRYEDLVDLKSVYMSCKKKVDKITKDGVAAPIIKRFRNQLFKAMENKHIPLRDTINTIWNNLQDVEVVTKGMTEITSKIEELETTIKMMQEQREAERIDATRQKFNYFSVIEFLLKKGLERGQIKLPKRKREEEPEEEEKQEQLPPKKNRKIAKVPKTTRKRRSQKQ